MSEINAEECRLVIGSEVIVGYRLLHRFHHHPLALLESTPVLYDVAKLRIRHHGTYTVRSSVWKVSDTKTETVRERERRDGKIASRRIMAAPLSRELGYAPNSLLVLSLERSSPCCCLVVAYNVLFLIYSLLL